MNYLILPTAMISRAAFTFITALACAVPVTAVGRLLLR